MQQILQFSPAAHRNWFTEHTLAFTAGEQFLAQNTNWVVVGHACRPVSFPCIAGPLAVEHHALIVCKLLRSGALGTTLLQWEREEMPDAVWKQFEAVFPFTQGHYLHDAFLRRIAEDVAANYGDALPLDAQALLATNPYWKGSPAHALKKKAGSLALAAIVPSVPDSFFGELELVTEKQKPEFLEEFAIAVRKAQALDAQLVELESALSLGQPKGSLFETTRLKLMRDLNTLMADIGPRLPASNLSSHQKFTECQTV